MSALMKSTAVAKGWVPGYFYADCEPCDYLGNLRENQDDADFDAREHNRAEHGAKGK